jgi:precorrin-3B synthase
MNASNPRCPGVVHAVPALDGLLIRVRLPGGAIAPAQLAALASVALGRIGAIDVTSRAGLQLRGIAASDLAAVTAALEGAGLVPSAAHDRVRNILASPFAGCDPDEAIDVRPLVRELDMRLTADPSLAQLPAKFAFALDGGGRAFPLGRVDLGLHAVRGGPSVAFAVSVDRDAPRFAIAPVHAVDALVAAARAAVDLCRRDSGGRLRSAEAHAAIAEAMLPHVPLPLLPPFARPAGTVPLGVLPAAHSERAILAPSLPLGRLTATQAAALASLAQQTGASLRFTPWRGVLIADVPRERVAPALATLAGAEFVLDGSDGFAGIAACAGLGACPAALADVRADAASLAHRVAAAPRRWHVNVAGCAKRCAMREGADVDLVAGDEGYTILINGAETLHGITPDEAVVLAVALNDRNGITP